VKNDIFNEKKAADANLQGNSKPALRPMINKVKPSSEDIGSVQDRIMRAKNDERMQSYE
jgi:hypothetical protein